MVYQRVNSFAGKNVMFILMISSPLPEDLCGRFFDCLLTHFFTFAFTSLVVILHWSGAPLHIQILCLSHVLDTTSLFFVTHKPTFFQFTVHFSFSDHC